MEMHSTQIGAGSGVYITTYGCQMNDHDSERMYSLLEFSGFHPVPTPDAADVIIINSCSVREKPVHKVLSEVGTYRELKARNPRLKIGVGGCVGQMDGEKLIKKAPLIDFVFGTDMIDELPSILSEVRGFNRRGAWTTVKHREPYNIETMIRDTKVTAFVTITKGCDNFCSFCIVPFTRGREKSRLLNDIVGDVQKLTSRGVKEIMLLGQNVNSYKSPDQNGDFADLLRAVCTETDIQRLRYTTSHPKDFNDAMIQIHVDHVKKLGTYLHLPVQSGNSRVLEAMNRGYTREEYLSKMRKFKAAIPGASLSTDIIVGFPGETEEEFEDTLSLLKEVQYESVFGFKYSERPFTKAAKMPGHLPEEVKEDRIRRLFELNKDIGEGLGGRYQDKIFDVLVEGPSRQNPTNLTGRTLSNKVVNFSGSRDLTGKTIPVKIIQAFPNSLRGEMVI